MVISLKFSEYLRFKPKKFRKLRKVHKNDETIDGLFECLSIRSWLDVGKLEAFTLHEFNGTEFRQFYE